MSECVCKFLEQLVTEFGLGTVDVKLIIQYTKATLDHKNKVRSQHTTTPTHKAFREYMYPSLCMCDRAPVQRASRWLCCCTGTPARRY